MTFESTMSMNLKEKDEQEKMVRTRRRREVQRQSHESKTSTYRRIWPERGEKTRLVEYRVLLLEPRHRGARAIVDTPSSHPRFHHIFHSVSRLIHMLLLMKPTRQFQFQSLIFHLRQHLNRSAWEKEFEIFLD